MSDPKPCPCCGATLTRDVNETSGQFYWYHKDPTDCALRTFQVRQKDIDAWNRRAPVRAWPDLVAPPKYENPHPSWEDPRLPDLSKIWAIARPLGYAVGVHGSLKRDCDLIAAPWVEGAAGAEHLIDALAAGLNARQIGSIEQKPQGRVAVTLQIDGWFKPIDLSIMPESAPVRVSLDHRYRTAEVKVAARDLVKVVGKVVQGDEVDYSMRLLQHVLHALGVKVENENNG